jgi:hypothetical protein
MRQIHEAIQHLHRGDFECATSYQGFEIDDIKRSAEFDHHRAKLAEEGKTRD